MKKYKKLLMVLFLVIALALFAFLALSNYKEATTGAQAFHQGASMRISIIGSIEAFFASIFVILGIYKTFFHSNKK